MATALASVYTRYTVRVDTAMTGEITLTGLVLPVGGIKEKVLAARRVGIKRVILPRENQKDLSELPEDVAKEMEFIFADKIEDVLSAAIPQLGEHFAALKSCVVTYRKRGLHYSSIGQRQSDRRGVVPLLSTPPWLKCDSPKSAQVGDFDPSLFFHWGSPAILCGWKKPLGEISSTMRRRWIEPPAKRVSKPSAPIPWISVKQRRSLTLLRTTDIPNRSCLAG